MLTIILRQNKYDHSFKIGIYHTDNNINGIFYTVNSYTGLLLRRWLFREKVIGAIDRYNSHYYWIWFVIAITHMDELNPSQAAMCILRTEYWATINDLTRALTRSSFLRVTLSLLMLTALPCLTVWVLIDV